MATILELAREVRQRLISKDTGCLQVDYPDQSVTIAFSDGALTTDRSIFLSCFVRDPMDFSFRSMEVGTPAEFGFGASLLIEALEAIEPQSLVRVWQPYSEWKIGFQLDPDIHNTLVKHHLDSKTERLRRLMRLAVSGSLTLEPPRTSIADEIARIEKAAAADDWYQVLGLVPGASELDIKQSFRKLAFRLHPDRWETSADPQLRDRVEHAFKRISHAYATLQQPRPQVPLVQPPPASLPPRPKKALWHRVYDLVRAK